MEIKPIRTGQSSCYDQHGNVIDCKNTGQDGEHRAGVTWPQPRFEPHSGFALDRLTGLSWPIDASLTEFPCTWSEALEWVTAQNDNGLLGFNDWRLPNRNELRSLISHHTTRPSLPAGHPFQNIFHGWYWSSTTAVISPAHAWYLDMAGGRMFFGGKDQSFMVWPVRGTGNGRLPVTGQTGCFDCAGRNTECHHAQDGKLQLGTRWPNPRFVANGAEVKDRLTGLAWRRVADSGNGPMHWVDALHAVAALSRESKQAWRLPNINELESLVDCARHCPALPANHPFEKISDIYWSSTTSRYQPDWAWALYLDKGAIGVGQKSQARFSAWAVKSPPHDP